MVEMTPKEKALELYNKCYQTTRTRVDHGRDCADIAIECALIAVEEIEKLIDELSEYYYSVEQNKYWQEVKQEIENL